MYHFSATVTPTLMGAVISYRFWSTVPGRREKTEDEGYRDLDDETFDGDAYAAAVGFLAEVSAHLSGILPRVESGVLSNERID